MVLTHYPWHPLSSGILRICFLCTLHVALGSCCLAVGIVNAGGADLDSGDLVSWLNCECFFSLVLVGLLAALPFNLHTQELMQSPETYVNRAKEFSGEGSFDKVLSVLILMGC